MRQRITTISLFIVLVFGIFLHAVPAQAATNACTDCLHSALSDCAGLADASARAKCIDDTRKDGGACREACSADSSGACVYCVTNAADTCSNSSSPQGCVDAIFSNGQCSNECKATGSGGGGLGAPCSASQPCSPEFECSAHGFCAVKNTGSGAGSNTSGSGIDFTIQGIYNIFIGLTCWFMRVAFLLIVIAIVWSGILFVISQGDLERYTKAKKSLGYALLGALVILGVYVIIYTVANAVGVQVTFFTC